MKKYSWMLLVAVMVLGFCFLAMAKKSKKPKLSEFEDQVARCNNCRHTLPDWKCLDILRKANASVTSNVKPDGCIYTTVDYTIPLVQISERDVFSGLKPRYNKKMTRKICWFYDNLPEPRGNLQDVLGAIEGSNKYLVADLWELHALINVRSDLLNVISFSLTALGSEIFFKKSSPMWNRTEFPIAYYVYDGVILQSHTYFKSCRFIAVGK